MVRANAASWGLLLAVPTGELRRHRAQAAFVLHHNRGNNDRNQVDHFDHRVERRASRVFQRVAYRVAYHRGFVAFRILARIFGRIARLIFDGFLGIIPSAARVDHVNR